MRRSIITFAVVVALLCGAVAGKAAAATADQPCSVVWGSLAKSSPVAQRSAVIGVRVGRHRCYDRVVIDLSGPVSGYRVQYVGALTEDGSGRPVTLAGGAILQIVALAPAYDIDSGKPTLAGSAVDATNVTGFATVRDMAFAGSFEGLTTIGLGVRARLPFRVFTLQGPGATSRIVVDVAHRW